MFASGAGQVRVRGRRARPSRTETLATGKAKLTTGSWHNMKLVFSGTSIKGLIDGTQVFSITDGT
jgi:hypothetical protein